MNKYLILVGWLSFFIVNSVNAQLIKTTLQITVRNGLGNIEPGVKVSLYATKDDYEKSINPVIAPLETDKSGKAIFKDIEAKAYYIQVEKGDLDNSGAGEIIEKLEPNRINKSTIVISE